MSNENLNSEQRQMAASAVSVVTHYPPKPVGNPLKTSWTHLQIHPAVKYEQGSSQTVCYLFLITELVVNGRFLRRLDFDFLRGRPV